MSKEKIHAAPTASHTMHDPPHQPAHNPTKQVVEHVAKPKTTPATPNALESNWKSVSAKLKEKWSTLTDDDLRFVDKTRSALVAKIHERTGLEPDTAERQLDALIGELTLGTS